MMKALLFILLIIAASASSAFSQQVGAARAEFVVDTGFVRADTVELWGRIVADSANTEEVSNFFVVLPDSMGRASGLPTSKFWWLEYEQDGGDLKCFCFSFYDMKLVGGEQSDQLKLIAYGLPSVVPTYTRGDRTTYEMPDTVDINPPPAFPYQFFESKGIGFEYHPRSNADTARISGITTQINEACAADMIPSAECTDTKSDWQAVAVAYDSGGRNAATSAIDAFLTTIAGWRNERPTGYWLLRVRIEHLRRWW